MVGSGVVVVGGVGDSVFGSGVVGPWVGFGPTVGDGGVHVGMVDGVDDADVLDVVGEGGGGGGGGGSDAQDADEIAVPARIATVEKAVRITAFGIAESVGINRTSGCGAMLDLTFP
jgi:hypothetical protein